MNTANESGPNVALVTGAGSGVGRATAQALDAIGYATVLVGRTPSKLHDTAETLNQPALSHPTDLTDPHACRAAIDAADERFGRIDVLANVAGWTTLAPIERITPDDWRRTIDTNLSAVVHLTAAAWPLFRRQNAGCVINVSSMASTDPFPGLAAYAAAKIGVNMFTRVTADEGEPIGVRAVCIIPGAVETPMLRSLFDTDTLPPDQTLDPADVAQLIVNCITGKRRVRSGSAVTITP